ncbi:MAG: hypothetical protein OEV93_04725 [Candidatus Moranbacteria bacterium]|nr:hypothetical protein [Candidatus Moranbacteria bacterium]
MIRKIFENKREIHRINVAHTIRSVALSFISIYVPVYLLTLGYSLSQIILFYAVFHLSGLVFTFLIINPLIQKWGILRTFKVYYPLEIAFYFLLYSLSLFDVSVWLVSVVGGMATFFYWVPLNILLIKHTKYDKMGSDLGSFFALPKIFKIVGPVVSAIVIPIFGFWPMFVLAGLGLILSYAPLAQIKRSSIRVSLQFKDAWKKIKKRKTLFVLEGFDNILEESEWFWGIYVYLMIGSLATPGIVGSLEALGGAIFTLWIGKYANKNSMKMVVFGSLGMMVISAFRIFVQDPLPTYALSVIASFVMTLFLISYFSVIYKAVKKDGDEEEFIILREIPTVLGRMVVFGSVLLVVSVPNLLFILPIVASSVMLLILYLRKHRFES